MYDYAIVGAGPTGLTCSYLLESAGFSCIVFDDRPFGDHRVEYENGYFHEHSPRVISGAYVNMKQILQSMGIDFDQIYTKYDLKFSDIYNDALSAFTWRELLILARYFVENSFSDLSTQTMLNMVTAHNFSLNAVNKIDRICRVVDGVNISKFAVSKFMNLIDQQLLYNLYQPKETNDKLLWQLWKKPTHLQLERILDLRELPDSVILNGTHRAKKVLLCMPPNAASGLVPINPAIANSMYDPGISVVFHFAGDLKLPNVNNLVDTEYGIVHLVSSNYTEFDHTVISCYLSKPPNVEDSEIIANTHKQLSALYGKLPSPYSAVISRENRAYIKTPDAPYMKPQVTPRIYSVGTHNGKSHYDFTTFESALSNAIHVCGELEDIPMKTESSWRLMNVILIIVLCIVFAMMYKKIHLNKSFKYVVSE